MGRGHRAGHSRERDCQSTWAAMISTTDEGASATNIYLLIVLKVGVHDGVGRASSFQGLSPWLACGVFSTCPNVVISVCVLTASSYKDTGHTGLGILDDLVVKNPPANARDVGSIPVLGRSPGVANGNPLQ